MSGPAEFDSSPLLPAVRAFDLNGSGAIGAESVAGFAALMAINGDPEGFGVTGSDYRNGIGVLGHVEGDDLPHEGYGIGVLGVSDHSPQGIGISAYSSKGIGLVVEAPEGDGLFAHSGEGAAIYAQSDASTGVFGLSSHGTGVFGQTLNPLDFGGVFRGGVRVEDGLEAIGDVTIFGDLIVSGMITKSVLAFRIEHPLDPRNKYLMHWGVESSEMKNLYDGIVIVDDLGEATVELPSWFVSLNEDFRYQLTSVGVPGPNLYVAQEVSDNRFKIAGAMPHSRVSWQVTGIRKDSYARSLNISLEGDLVESKAAEYVGPKAPTSPHFKLPKLPTRPLPNSQVRRTKKPPSKR